MPGNFSIFPLRGFMFEYLCLSKVIRRTRPTCPPYRLLNKVIADDLHGRSVPLRFKQKLRFGSAFGDHLKKLEQIAIERSASKS